MQTEVMPVFISYTKTTLLYIFLQKRRRSQCDKWFLSPPALLLPYETAPEENFAPFRVSALL